MLDPRDPPEAPLFDDRDRALYGHKGAYNPRDLVGLVLVESPDDQVFDHRTWRWMKRSEFEAASRILADDPFNEQASRME